MKKSNIILTVFFCGFFAAMSLMFIFSSKDEYSEREKRVLAEFPTFSLENLADGSFFAGIDSYITDHFFMRDFWVGLNSYKIQALGQNAAGEVYLGKNDWLIEKPVSDTVTLRQNIEVIKNFVTMHENESISLMLIPTKGAVMEENLPVLHDEYIDEQLIKSVQNTINAQNIDVFSTLCEAVNPYYRTDHHWTSEGAYAAYCKAGEVMGFEPISKNKFTINTYDDFYGTSYSKSGLWAIKPDKIELWTNDDVKIKVTIKDDNMPFEVTNDGVFFYENLTESDKYPVFLDGNHGFVSLSSDIAHDKKLLIIRDSFSHCLAPFFAYNYKTVDLIDLRYFKSQTVSELIENNNYTDIVIAIGLNTLATDRSIQWLE